ncbi:DUF4065 domain-containing protein [Campylobacter jejuni]|nr:MULTISPECIES: type II toxin-antitoxin system antitoxin SocA domain-containing protein [Campylobacter]EAB5332913.1 DUF4065 domain-containing protein [Campylobacter jejuni]EAC1424932.1 DUF4065 domain-containing protein [Campylobacter jejuni]EAC2004135.1 DUF4065 domain-containing protein [Campylobacter jejuni]EAC2086635.1 DUF4065 domain-containing protein [Campylobacter jejuni]EAH4753613.1 DUF4065 domain-containing protein [Campylobacter jejuni]
MKAIDVAKYLITINEQKNKDESNSLSKLKLQKLLYYSQGYYSAIYDKPLFDEEIRAWEHGPVVKEVYDHFKNLEGNTIHFNEENTLNEQELKNMSLEEKEIIDEVYELMGQYSAWKLRDKTHNELPWLETYDEKYKTDEQKNIISKEKIRKYFKNYIEDEEEN